MKRFATLAVVALVVCGGRWAAAENSVTIESMTVAVNQQGVTIPIRIVNDVELLSIVVPLEIREVTPGAFITGLSMSLGDRLSAGLEGGFWGFSQYAERGNGCADGSPGYETLTASGPEHRPVAAPPEGAAIWWARFTDPILLPGADVTGSMSMTVDIGATGGTFEIDTICVAPVNHLVFVTSDPQIPITPAFTPGLITIRANSAPTPVCGDVTVSADASCTAVATVDAGSFDPDGDPISLSQTPPGPYPLGETAVELIVTDPFGAQSSCFATVTVEDATPPVVTCPMDVAVPSDSGSIGAVVHFPMATASDDCSAVTVTCTPLSGSFFGPGTTEVVCTATDAAGNSSACSFSVTVGLPCNDVPLDINCDGVANVLDVVEAVNEIFRGDGYKAPCCIEP